MYFRRLDIQNGFQGRKTEIHYSTVDLFKTWLIFLLLSLLLSHLSYHLPSYTGLSFPFLKLPVIISLSHFLLFPRNM
jgi:ABC-type xylose transport system permease subunit